MAAPSGVLWDRDPHTAAKHDILREYLGAWFPIIARACPSGGLTYIDAFAGPGEYKDGAIGSPLLALAQARRPEVLKYGTQQKLIFIEEQKNRIDHLTGLLETHYPEVQRSPLIKILLERGDCRQILIPALTQHGIHDGPIFANLDGWGVDTPMSLLRHIGRMRTAEVLITFKPDWFWRFVNAPEAAAGDRVFGDSQWRLIATSGAGDERKRNLISHYREQLQTAGFEFPLSFELVDEGGHGLLLVYGTSNALGIEKMKDAMWKVDAVQGQRFRDPRDVDQLTLEISNDPDLALLKRQLLDRVVREGRMSLDALKRYTLLESIYRPAHATTAIKELEGELMVNVTWKKGHDETTVEPSLLAALR